MRYLLLLASTVSLFAQNYKVQTASGLVELTAEAYVAGVVTGESGEFKSAEALKAMAVTARTYAARMRGRHSKEGFDFCSLTHCQRFVTASGRAIAAARETAGQILWFQDKPAFSVYSRSCGGRTEDVSAVWTDVSAPYLKSHADPYCSQQWAWSGTLEEVSRALARAGLKGPAQLTNITIIARTASGRARLLSLNGELMSASTFRFALGRTLGWNTIRSEQYFIENAGDRILFRGSGEGHGVGLCQDGADEMGFQGKTYREILDFYYPGTTVDTHVNLHWRRLSGEGVILYTMLPDSDREVIGSAEAVLHKWRGWLPWPTPNSISIYVYPSMDAFRNSTGEPGWVAARTQGTKIEMQPSEVLRSHHALQSTLEHELLHSFVESAARSGLPVWFGEGLVEYLAGGSAVAAQTNSEADLRQRTDRQGAEKAYRSAQVRVQELVNRYGEAAVLGWVTRGLPETVKYSTASNPAVKSR